MKRFPISMEEMLNGSNRTDIMVVYYEVNFRRYRNNHVNIGSLEMLRR